MTSSKSLSIGAYVGQVIDEDYKTKRFTTKDLTDDICGRLGMNPKGSQVVCVEDDGGDVFVKINSYRAMFDPCIRALERKKDRDGCRLFYHSTAKPRPVWFHRDISTPDEEIRFGQYLIDQGQSIEEEGNNIVDRGRKRKSKLRRRPHDDDQPPELRPD